MKEDLENLEGMDDEEFDGMIELTDEEGNTEQFELLASFTVDDDQYLAVSDPIDEEEEPESVDVFFLRVEKDENGEDMYVSVDNDEADRVYEEFLKVVDALDEEE